jgi:hypothetical protein
MNDYNLSVPFPKISTKVIQLELTGMDDTSTQSTKQMKDTTGSCITPRVLKVAEIGDFWAKRTMPSIRLQGKWMLRAGVLPNHHVQITNPSPGVLLIQLLEDIPQTAEVGFQTSSPNPLKNQTTKRRH